MATKRTPYPVRFELAAAVRQLLIADGFAEEDVRVAVGYVAMGPDFSLTVLEFYRAAIRHICAHHTGTRETSADPSDSDRRRLRSLHPG
jgi:hypothetical protein